MRMGAGTLLSPRGTSERTASVPSSTSGTTPPPSTTPPPRPPVWRRWIWPTMLLITALLLFSPLQIAPTPQTLTYTEFVDDVVANKVATAVIDDTGAVTGTLVGGATYTSAVPTALDNAGLSQQLLDHKVAVTGTVASSNVILDVLISFLPYLIMIALAVWWFRRSARQVGSGGSGFGGLMGVGRSRAKLYDQEKPTTRFSDIAGYEGAKAEVMEVVDFLKYPGRYARAGAVGPKGVLMVGPPGTGKTLLARAVAGEAEVPFFALSGSSFVEMFVGVGASRVRSLFEDARRNSPSIIFIDEIDAIGGHRGRGGFASNDEREQTLNQLLSEMDGFEIDSSVVVIAATNRAEILDAALLRPGRFDRTVEIPLPNQRERTEILTIHARGKLLAADVDLGRVSRGTAGFAGADLANLINEAAINAVRASRDVLTASDFDAARERLLIGRRESTNALLPSEKDAVAVHEAGHALVAVLSEHTDPVAKITILPRGSALGVTEQLPESERHLYAESYLKDALAVRMGGRAAEILLMGEASTGAANDLASATGLATRMVREWGLSAALGPVGYGSDGSAPDNPFAGRPYAENTQRAIDREVARLLSEAEATATALLDANRTMLDLLVTVLLDRETIDGSDLAAILGLPERSPVKERSWARGSAAATRADGRPA